MTPRQFHLFGGEHLLILGLVVLVMAGMIFSARRHPTTATPLARGWAALLMLNYFWYSWHRLDTGQWDLRYDLPMEFCDWATAAAVIALWSRRPLFFELAYFWILAGSLQGLLTPDVPFAFPHRQYFMFFIGHGGIVIAAFYLLFGLNLRPRKNSILRVFLCLQVYFLCALAVNLLLKTNYGYIMAKPANPSVLDFMGPWPWYLLSLECLALVLFVLMYLPFSGKQDGIQNCR